jgi:hypothetical protein
LNIIEKFEKETGISAETLTEETMIQIMQNPEFSHFFTDTKEA